MKMFLLAFIVLPYYALGAETGCHVSLDNLTEFSSLVIERGNPRFSPHVEDNGLVFKEGQEVSFVCPNTSISMQVDSFVIRELLRGACYSGSTFRIRNKLYDFSHLRCTSEPLLTIMPSKCRYGVRYDIGYVAEDEFVGMVTVCYDKTRHTALETNHTISMHLPREEDQQRRPHKRSSEDFFGEDMAENIGDLYMCVNQQYFLERILGEMSVQRYLNCSPDSTSQLVPAQLVPREDFLFPLQQMTSDYYLNTLPLWQLLSGGNWKRLETSVRRYARERQRDLSVYTGALGVAVLKNSEGEILQLHLARNAEETPVVPVPSIVWKLVYDPVDDAGIVFVGVNNLDPTLIVSGYLVKCHCICNTTSSWFQGWSRVDLSQGYIYCCEVGQFIKETSKYHLPSPANVLL